MIKIENNLEQYLETPYGGELILDLHGCNRAKFTRDCLDLYFTKLCDLIHMEKCEVHFWDDIGVPPDERQTSPHTKGTADLDDENVRLFLLQSIDDTGTVKGSYVESLRGLRADQVLTSSAFSLPETRNPEIGKQLERFRTLLLRDSLEREQEEELRTLRKIVDEKVPGLAEREEDRVLERRLSEWLLSMNIQEKKSDR